MKDLKQALLEAISQVINERDSNKRLVVYLEGGYYDTRFGPQEFSLNTLSTCIKVAEEMIIEKYRITRVVLGVLINDIGISCGEDTCVIAQPSNNDSQEKEKKLPVSLEEMFKKSKVTKRDKVEITFERTLRNRGLRVVKDIVKDPKKYSLVVDKNEKDGALYNIQIDNNKIPLAIKNHETWSARCPLIMGQHYSDLYMKIVKKYGQSTDVLLVDMSEMYDRHKVNNGAKVALLLLSKLYGYHTNNLQILNFCFHDDELTQYESDLTKGVV